jgi:hypothetical protein
MQMIGLNSKLAAGSNIKNYAISKTMHEQRPNSHNFRQVYSQSYESDGGLFRKTGVPLAKHLDAGKTAITRPSHIGAIMSHSASRLPRPF